MAPLISRTWRRLLATYGGQHHVNGAAPNGRDRFSAGDSKSSTHRPVLLAFLLPTGVLLLVLVLAAITSPELTTRRARLARAIASTRPDTSTRQALSNFYRSSFTRPPLPSDPPFLKLDIIPPENPSGFGTGWTFLMIHALAESNAASAYQWREGLVKGADLTGARWIIPQAGMREQPAVAAPQGEAAEPTGGAMQHAWFGMNNWTDLHRGEDERAYMESARMIAQTIRREITDKGVPMSRVIIGGFSQGTRRPSAFEMWEIDSRSQARSCPCSSP